MISIGRKIIAVAVIFLLPYVSPAAGGDTEAQTYRNEIEEWHRARIERLKKPDGYLSLVGLFPLDEGHNRFGSAEDNELVFPENAPAYAGVFILKDGLVRISVEDGIEIFEDSTRITEKQMKPDTDNPGSRTIKQMSDSEIN